MLQDVVLLFAGDDTTSRSSRHFCSFTAKHSTTRLRSLQSSACSCYHIATIGRCTLWSADNSFLPVAVAAILTACVGAAKYVHIVSHDRTFFRDNRIGVAFFVYLVVLVTQLRIFLYCLFFSVSVEWLAVTTNMHCIHCLVGHQPHWLLNCTLNVALPFVSLSFFWFRREMSYRTVFLFTFWWTVNVKVSTSWAI